MSAPDQPRIVVVGAGITGLTAAYRLSQLVPEASIEVVEAAPEVGGKIRSTPVDGLMVDEAADAFLARVPAAIELCRELGLGDDLVSPAERRAFVYRHGALHRFPEGLVLGVPTDLETLRASGLVSPEAVDRAALDLLDDALPPGPPAGDDESVGALVRRRLGDEIFDALVGPLLSGVNAGDADELSVAAGAPQLAAAVRDQPSLIRGLQAQRDAAAAAPSHVPEAPIFHGLRGGTQTLTDALAAHLPPGAVHLSTAVTMIGPTADDRYLVHGDPLAADDGAAGVALAQVADAVVLATPSFVTADLVERFVPDVAAGLRALEWSDVAMVTFVVPRAQIEHPLDGSGFLVAGGEDLLMTACSFGSSKWRHWHDPLRDLAVLRVSAGRHHDRRALDLDDDALVERLTADLGTTIGLHGEPTVVRVSRWARALPQYRPGHLERAAAWQRDTAAAAPGLFLAGASYFGLGIPACIVDAQRAAGQVVTHLAGRGRAGAPR